MTQIIKQRLFAFTVCGIAGLFLAYEFILQVSPNVMTQQLMHSFGINAVALGTLVSFYYYSYAPMQLVAGLSYDRLGARNTLTLAILTCAVGTAVIGWSHSPFWLGFGRFLTGLGSAASFVGLLFLGRSWFANKYFFLVAGLTEFLGCLGAVIGGGPTAMMVNAWGWRATLIGLAVVGFVLTVLAFLIVRESPKTRQAKPEIVRTASPLVERLKQVLGRGQFWAISLYALMVFAPIPAFAALWGVPFLTSAYDISSTVAGFACSMIWVGMGIGSVLAGWISELLGSRKIPLVTGALLGVIVTLAILYIHVSIPVLYGLMFLFGVATLGQSLSFNAINDNAELSIAGTAMGFNNMLVVLSGAATQPIIGMILHAVWDGAKKHGSPIYDVGDYQLALLMLPLFYLLAALIGMFFIKETHCRHISQRQQT